MSDPLDELFVTGEEAQKLNRDKQLADLAVYLDRMPSELKPLFRERFALIDSAELMQLRAAAAELQEAHVYLDESYINDPDAAPLSLADRIAPLVKAAAERDALQEATKRDIKALTGLAEGFHEYASGDYCQTYNCGMAQGLNAAADAIEAYVSGMSQRIAAHPATPAQEQGGEAA